MFVYRITNAGHAALDGMGGLYGSGRWHKKGTPIIYTSEHASLAAWEKIVHVASFENLQKNLLLIKIEIPENIEVSSVPENILIKGWDNFPFANETINFGTEFLRKKENLVLKVPTVIIPDEFNVILNPMHPEIHRCKVISSIPFIFDKRVSKF
jgi:RES domain-containing protein